VPHHFRWQRVFRHHEHLTWLWSAVALGVLWAKAVGWLHVIAVDAAHDVSWLARVFR
jgi:hypothetical protein